MSPRMGANPRDSHRNGRVAFHPMLASLARACVRHRWIVIGAWVALLVVINGIAGAVGPDYRTDFVLPDSESKEVQDLLEANSPTGPASRRRSSSRPTRASTTRRCRRR